MLNCNKCNCQLPNNFNDWLVYYSAWDKGETKKFCLPCWKKEEKNHREKFSDKITALGLAFKRQKNAHYDCLFFDKEKKKWMTWDDTHDESIRVDGDVVLGEDEVPPVDSSDNNERDEQSKNFAKEKIKELKKTLAEKEAENDKLKQEIENLKKGIRVEKYVIFLVIVIIILVGAIGYFWGGKSKRK